MESLQFCGAVALPRCRDFLSEIKHYAKTKVQVVVFASAIFSAALVHRFFRARRLCAAGTRMHALPYVSHFTACGHRELVVVNTMHISPRSSEDVSRTIDLVQPSCILIELDQSRLAALTNKRQIVHHDQTDMQPFTLQTEHGSDCSLPTHDFVAVRAGWNRYFAGSLVEAPLATNLETCNAAVLLLDYDPQRVCRDVLLAQKAGAVAVIFQTNIAFNAKRLCVQWSFLEVFAAISSFECNALQLPCLLLLPQDSTRLRETLANVNHLTSMVRFTIRSDHYRCAPLKQILLRRAVFCFSGVWILYGCLRIGGVSVGDEFRAAVISSERHEVFCKCCDLSISELGAYLRQYLKPTYENVCAAAGQWLDFPYSIWRLVFPADTDVDTLGCTFLQCLALPFRTWLVTFGAATAASIVLNAALTSPGKILGNALAIVSDDVSILRERFTFSLFMYLLPRVKAAMLDARDEAMYSEVVKTFLALDDREDPNPKRIVLVCGSAHGRGIAHRARTRGFA